MSLLDPLEVMSQAQKLVLANKIGIPSWLLEADPDFKGVCGDLLRGYLQKPLTLPAPQLPEKDQPGKDPFAPGTELILKYALGGDPAEGSSSTSYTLVGSSKYGAHPSPLSGLLDLVNHVTHGTMSMRQWRSQLRRTWMTPAERFRHNLEAMWPCRLR